jgi:hypothetical protein
VDTAGAVLGVAAVAAVASCQHACYLVRAHGEAGWESVIDCSPRALAGLGEPAR